MKMVNSENGEVDVQGYYILVLQYRWGPEAVGLPDLAAGPSLSPIATQKSTRQHASPRLLPVPSPCRRGITARLSVATWSWRFGSPPVLTGPVFLLYKP